MNVLHVSTHDHGGAGIAALRLHDALRQRGHESRMLVLVKRSGDPDVVEFKASRLWLDRWRITFSRTLLRVLSRSDYYFQDGNMSVPFRVDAVGALREFVPDVIIAHWISNFMSMQALVNFAKNTGAPVIFHLLDMSFLTGGCHYAWGCRGYEKLCGGCPALRCPEVEDLSFKVMQEKLIALSSINCAAVTPSAHLEEQTARSTLFGSRVRRKILLSVDASIFTPLENRQDARQALGLPRDKVIVFFGALSKSVNRKGAMYLREALGFLRARLGQMADQIVVATAGAHVENIFRDLSFLHVHLGTLHSDKLLAAAYQAADLYVCPSVEDSGPMMINESIMCGTPVVAFDMGVARDLVITGTTGFCAKHMDSENLAEGMIRIITLSPEARRLMGESCRQLGTNYLHPTIQASAFESLIEEVRNSGAPRSIM